MSENSSRLSLALVGCGGMGTRHLHGLRELEQAGLSKWDLVAVCDVESERAEAVANLAQEFFGRRPSVFTDLSRLVKETKPDAVDVVTVVRTHHEVVAEALDGGLHVMVEKPLAITMKASTQIELAVKRSGLTVSVAENYRRDPMNRLIKAVIESGKLGEPRMLVECRINPGRSVLITPWRHEKTSGGLLLDVGVHYADILQYFIGPPRSVHGRAALLEPVRIAQPADSITGSFYELVNRNVAGEIKPTAEDSASALFEFDGGCFAQWTLILGVGGGDSIQYRRIQFENGTIVCPPDRTGQPVAVHFSGSDEPLIGDAALDLVPDFRLDRQAAILFGAERIGSYELPFAETDRKITALEYWELARCVSDGVSPEVGILEGQIGLATVYAVLESSEAGTPVNLEDVMERKSYSYQSQVDDELGIE